jgi:hypothetical protein
MGDGHDESTASAVPKEPPECQWVRAAGTLWRNAGESLILLPVAGEGQTTLVVSGSAAVMWELLSEPVTLTELAVELAAIYQVEGPLIEVDLAPVLEGLYAAAAVDRSP